MYVKSKEYLLIFFFVWIKICETLWSIWLKSYGEYKVWVCVLFSFDTGWRVSKRFFFSYTVLCSLFSRHSYYQTTYMTQRQNYLEIKEENVARYQYLANMDQCQAKNIYVGMYCMYSVLLRLMSDKQTNTCADSVLSLFHGSHSHGLDVTFQIKKTHVSKVYTENSWMLLLCHWTSGWKILWPNEVIRTSAWIICEILNLNCVCIIIYALFSRLFHVFCMPITAFPI